MYTHTHSLQTCQNHFADICSDSSEEAEHSSWAPCGWGPAEAAAHRYLLAQAPALPSPESSCPSASPGALQMGRAGVVVPRLRPLMGHIISWAGYLGSVHCCHWTPHRLEWWELSDQQKLLTGQDQVPFFHLQYNVLCTQSFQLHPQVRWGDEQHGEHYG